MTAFLRRESDAAPLGEAHEQNPVATRLSAGQDQEVELKLDLNPADIERLAGSALFAAAAEQDQESIYYDTSTDTLRQAGLSLRVRRTGERYVQTVKAAGAAAAGLFARSEWERDVPDAQPVLDETGRPLNVLLASSGPLEAAFRVDVARRTALIDRHGGRIEIVFDRGRISSSGQEEPVCEVELELKGGDSAALFATAREIDAIVPLRLGVLTKSERGYRLRQVDPDKAVKAEPVELDRAMSCATGFQTIAYACLRQFRLNEAILARTGAADSLHQLRVSLRRLRSAMSIFKPMLADDRFETISADLRWISSALGDARNIDVLLDRITSRRTAKPLRKARERAYVAAREALDSPRLRAAMIDLAEWIATGQWLVAPADPALRDRPLSAFAIEVLDRYRRRVKRRGDGLARLGDDERHEVRIQAKKLRYSGEFFSSLFPSEARTRRRKVFLGALEDLQNELGKLNDLAITPPLLEQLGLAGTPVAEALAADGDSRGKLLDRAERAHDRLIATKQFWR
jgi:inorganic triphosphatase YgiF